LPKNRTTVAGIPNKFCANGKKKKKKTFKNYRDVLGISVISGDFGTLMDLPIFEH
jgi:hypothetical protein